MEWSPARWLVFLPLLIFPCTIKSRSSLLAPAHLGGPGKRAVKRLWCVWWCGVINKYSVQLQWLWEGLTCYKHDINTKSEHLTWSRTNATTITLNKVVDADPVISRVLCNVTVNKLLTTGLQPMLQFLVTGDKRLMFCCTFLTCSQLILHKPSTAGNHSCSSRNNISSIESVITTVLWLL